MLPVRSGASPLHPTRLRRAAEAGVMRTYKSHNLLQFDSDFGLDFHDKNFKKVLCLKII